MPSISGSRAKETGMNTKIPSWMWSWQILSIKCIKRPPQFHRCVWTILLLCEVAMRINVVAPRKGISKHVPTIYPAFKKFTVLWISDKLVCFVFCVFMNLKHIRIKTWFSSKTCLSTRGFYNVLYGFIWVHGSNMDCCQAVWVMLIGWGKSSWSGRPLPTANATRSLQSQGPHDLCRLSLWLVVLGVVALGAWVIGSVL